MAFKLYIPKKEDNNWADYWDRTSMAENLVNCETDGLLPILFKYLPQREKIIEAGCGLGKWVMYLRSHGYDIAGIDSYPGVIKAAKKIDRTLPVSVGDVANLPFPSGSVSCYLSFGVIEHFEEGPQKPLREALRVLKEGGVAIIETPNDNPLRRFVRVLRRLRYIIKTPARIFVETFGVRPKRVLPEQYFYEYHYTKNELVNFVKKTGFKIIGSYPKDDLSPKRSIGLWIDFPCLRQKGAGEFVLSPVGRIVKLILSPFPELWSACMVVVAKKE